MIFDHNVFDAARNLRIEFCFVIVLEFLIHLTL